MNNSADCSVIIPAYNAEDTIASAIGSLYKNGSRYDIEVLVIDDGSSDRTAGIVEALKKDCPSLELIQKENGGVSSARNAGLKAVGGHFIFFMDSDDEINRPALEQMIAAGYETGADMLIADFERVDTVRQCTETVGTRFLKETVLDKAYITNDIFPRFIGGGAQEMSPLWNKLYVRERILETGLSFNVDRTHGEDWEFNLRYLDAAESVYCVDCVVYRYRVDGTQVFSKYKKGLGQGYADGYRLLCGLIEKYSLTQKDEKLLIKLMRGTAFNFIGLLKMEEIGDREKKALLRTPEAKQVFSTLSKLDRQELSGMDLSRKDKAAFLLLSKGLYHTALKMI